jgi:hypothetical protein
MIPFAPAGSPRHAPAKAFLCIGRISCSGLPPALYFGPLTRNLPAKSSAAIVNNNGFGRAANSPAKSRTAASHNNKLQCNPSHITLNRKTAAGASRTKQKPGAVSRPGTIPEFQFPE